MERVDQEHVQEAEPAREPYSPPQLTRWGTIRELTLGSGGRKGEPSKKMSRM
jgi:hypothetical protein